MGWNEAEGMILVLLLPHSHQILEQHNFRGLPFSKISRKRFSRTKDSISINTVRGSMPSAKNTKIMWLEN